MMLVANLVCFGLRQALGDGVERILDPIGERFRDHTRALPRALARSNDRAWQALAVALAGDGLVDQVKLLFASTDAKTLREQMRPFLLHSAAYFDQTPTAFRKACLSELHAARKEGLLSADGLTAGFLAPRLATFPFTADPQALLDGAARAVARLADDLAAQCPGLARLLRQPPPGGPPLLVAAFAFFFRREVETDVQLFHALTFDGLRSLSAAQSAAFEEVEKGLAELGDRFDAVLGQLGHIETTVVATHDAVLDLRVELERLGRDHAEAMSQVRQLIEHSLSNALVPAPRSSAIPEELVRALEKRLRQGLAQRSSSVEDVLQALGLPGPRRSPPAPLTNDLGMTFVWVPGGAFLMGSPPEEPHRRSDEAAHGVTLAHGFHLAVHPVTQEQWRAVLGGAPSRFAGDDRPVEMVSWDDCQELCRKLSELDGLTYRLPTEAEWERACRAGTAGPFSFGADLTTDEANHDGRGPARSGAFRGETTPVGSFPANAWGLYDMHGNVWEWCADWYGPYAEGHVTGPTGPREGEERVLRGGSWFNPPWSCRSATRYGADPATRSAHLGVRLAITGPRVAGPRW